MKRQKIERQIVRKVIDDAISAGYTLSVFDGEEETLSNCGDAQAVFDAMFTTDQDHLYLLKGGKDIGWVFFVYGNSGWDVINDHTTNIEMILDGANVLSEQLEQKHA
jgi:hypothetical protein